MQHRIQEVLMVDLHLQDIDIYPKNGQNLEFYRVQMSLNKIHSYTQVQSRETGERFPNWLQVEKSIYYDDKNRIDKFYYIFNEPHPEWRGTEPQIKWKYIFSYN